MSTPRAATTPEQSDAAELRRQLRATQNLMRRAPGFLLCVASDGVVLNLNDEALASIDARRHNVLGRVVWQCPWFHTLPEAAARVRQAVHAAARGKSSQFETPCGSPEHPRWLRLRISPMDDAQQIAISGTDLTDLTVAQQQLHQALVARDTFLGLASHELRTPLTTLMLQNQLQQRRFNQAGDHAVTAEAIRQAIGKTIAQTERLARLVDDMLDVSRIAAGKLSVGMEPMDWAHVVRDTVADFEPQLSMVGCTISCDIVPSAPILGDAFRLEQVLANLLTNAMRYAAGRPVHVSLERDEDQVVLRVRDEGPGIASHELQRIFECFERLNPANHMGGLGLGLHISREIVRAHGGEIRGISGDGRGTVFVVALPSS